ncbi:MAG: DUF5677 domain-containing protein [Rhodococcus sp. (in: high G+C Gram-positive bacteria)]
MQIPRANEKTGPLAGHVRKGRTYRSPLAATGVLQIADWVRSDLPDLLWPVLTLCELGTESAKRFIEWQKAVQADLSTHGDIGFVAKCLDGSMTGLEQLATRIPSAKAIVRSRARELGLLPETVVSALSAYPFPAGAWLVDREVSPPGSGQIELLQRAVLEVVGDGHREAVVKCLYIWSLLHAGTFSADVQTIELLKRYPVDRVKREMADSVVRASWGAHKAVEALNNETRFIASKSVATMFWQVNSVTTRCVRARELQVEPDKPTVAPPSDSAELGSVGTADASTEDGAHLQQLAMDLLSSYVEALETSPTDLSESAKQEVHSGLVARVGRDVIAVLGAPDLWSVEHSAHLVRALVEVRIYIEWMALQETSIYKVFQEYGAGKAKLYARILDELPEDARTPGFEDAVEQMDALSHNNEILDHRTVDTRDSFAEGKSIRSMASDCGLLDFYRHAYSVSSGVAHSEWWSVESHAMERCMNVLHGGHLIPSLSLDAGGNVELASSWVSQLHTLMWTSMRILGVEGWAVSQAFGWLQDLDEKGAD